MNSPQTPAELRLVHARQDLATAYAERTAAVRGAREQKITWRRIAAALELTEQGAKAILLRDDSRTNR